MKTLKIESAKMGFRCTWFIAVIICFFILPFFMEEVDMYNAALSFFYLYFGAYLFNLDLK